jgi:hypothetical protein
VKGWSGSPGSAVLASLNLSCGTSSKPLLYLRLFIKIAVSGDACAVPRRRVGDEVSSNQ